MSTPRTPERKRQLRRRHKRERQAIVFGALVAGLAVAGLGSAAVLTDSIEPPFTREFTTVSPSPTETVLAVPCPPDETMPVAYSDIQVLVMNGTNTPGLAGRTAELLGQRGFDIVGTENFPVRVPGTVRVDFGAEGIAHAYTLAAHLVSPVLVYDAREGTDVTVAVGVEFGELVPVELVPLDPELPLVGERGCIPLEVATPAPAPEPTDGDGEDTGEDEADDEASEA